MRRVLLVAALILLTSPTRAGAEWRGLRTDHFQVMGDVSSGRLQDVALRFDLTIPFARFAARADCHSPSLL